jgi:hypothetical protein
MRLRSHRPNVVIWSSRGAKEPPRRARPRRIRGRLRTGALLALIGLIWLARSVRTRWRGTLGLAGWTVTMIGITLPSGAVLVSGFVVLLVTVFLPADPSARFGSNAGWPRCWAEPCLPFFASSRRPGDR